MNWWQNFAGTLEPGYRKRRREAVGNAFAFLLCGFGLAYFLSEMIMQRFMHPLHWGIAGVSALVIYVVAFVWLLRRSYIRRVARSKRR